MAEVNLCKLLKGHEGETFYSPIYGDVHIRSIEESCIIFGPVNESAIRLSLASNGHHLFYPDKGECLIFPSKYQQDWNKWSREQKPKVWSDVKHCNAEVWQAISNMDYGAVEPIVKSALALLKIHELIEQGYGGNITKDEWKDFTISKFYISLIDSHVPITHTNNYYHEPIAFHTRELAEEFRSYDENVQLIMDFYQYE